MAVLYALDRRGAADRIRDDLETHDVVLLDRYVASNAAYSAARLHQDEHGEFVEWVRALEIDRFGLPVPDLHLLLRVPVEVAAERAAKREQDDDTASPRHLRVRWRRCRPGAAWFTTDWRTSTGSRRGKWSTGGQT